MPKRFTDSEKWKKPFIRSLEAPYKLLWFYILDDCDHAGIWQADIEVAQIKIGEKIDIEKAKKCLKGKIIVFNNGEKWFIPDFIEFQYGKLNENNRVHNSVLLQLKKYNLIDKNLKIKEYIRPLQGPKDKDKDKDLDKDKDQDKDLNEIINYFNEKVNKKFTLKSKANNSIINARLNEGFTIEDFKKIIDNKCKSWLGTKMDEYLRPETLFCTKHFESYLNEKPTRTSDDITDDYLKKIEDENKGN